ncbi:uncharacterized protein LOC127653060 [Xyrauchen texanus]|uniref:uncharacterized protein LOC127653060 n=1 Tax=Xyrauchen texanus TaxID=154827 RepID=UPI002241DDF3|nr:uncharacterized protein LOC127653060 [Xyrauchen texanus]XP_051995528.1 uncharacterized protein LOC127653060 [Xyrauchen texanus]
MHWLPLVAMVIASALPFPQSPVPRLVAATIEPGRNNSNSSMPVNSSMYNNSHDATSHNNSSNLNYSRHDKAPHRTFDKHEQSEVINSTFTYEENHLSNRRANQENLLTEHIFFNTTKKQDHTGGGRTTRVDASRSYEHREYELQKKLAEKASPDDFLSNNILKDYKLSHEESSIGTENSLKDDRNTGSKLKDEVLDGSKKTNISLEMFPIQEDSQSDGSSNGGTLGEQDGGSAEVVAMNTLEEVLGAKLGIGLDDVGLWEEDQMLLLDAHPRVLFSPALSPPKHPPLLLMLELGLLADDLEENHFMDLTPSREGGDRESYRNLLLGLSGSDGPSLSFTSSHNPNTLVRHKRYIGHSTQGRERSVCEAENKWVTDKKTAIDQMSKTVTVLPEIQTQKGPIKQYFFETRCRKPSQLGTGEVHGVEGAECIGVDNRHWMSKCETKQSYVRALTSDENKRVGWRWIRIDSSCVCVLLTRGTYNKERGREQEGRRYR